MSSNLKASWLVLSLHDGVKQHTVAQKTAQVFACFCKIVLLWDDDVTQNPEIFMQENTTS